MKNLQSYKLLWLLCMLLITTYTQAQDLEEWESATEITLNTPVEGVLANSDDFHWYKLEVTESELNIRFLVNYDFPDIEILRMRIYKHITEGDDSYLNNIGYYGGYSGISELDYYNIEQGTYYILLDQTYEGSGDFTFMATSSPFVIGFSVSQFNNMVKIQNRSTGAYFEYEMGDGNYYGYREYVTHEYDQPGDYIITQYVYPFVMSNASAPQKDKSGVIARSTADNTPYITQKMITIKGIESYTPQIAGVGGDAIITVYGGGLDENTEIQLIKGGTILYPDTILKPVFKESASRHYAPSDNHDVVIPEHESKGYINALFNFHLAEPGEYDVSIAYEGEEPVVFEKGFLLEDYKYPYITSSIDGYATLRTGSRWNYTLQLTNNGNVMANGVNVYLAMPDEVNFYSLLEPFSSTIDPAESFNFTLSSSGNEITIPNSKVLAVMDSLYTNYIEVDSLFGEAFKGRIYKIYVPKVNASSSLSIPFQVESTTSIDNTATKMFSFVAPIHLFGSKASPITESSLSLELSLILAGIDQLPITERGPYYDLLNKIGDATKASLDAGSLIAGHLIKDLGISSDEVNAYLSSGQMDKSMADVITSLQELTETLQTDLPDLTIKIKEHLENRNTLEQQSLESSDGTQGIDAFKGIHLDLDSQIDLINDLKEVNTNDGNLKDVSESVIKAIEKAGKATGNAADAIKDYLENWKTENPENADQAVEILKNMFDKNRGQENLFRKLLTIGTSVDPNEIEGPAGYASNRYIRDGEMMSYIVRFENLPSATLPAQIVNVYDTLNVQLFDLETFELGSISIADTTFTIPPGRKSYVFDYDMRPEQNLSVSISASIEMNTGAIHWQFVSLDPDWGGVTGDPLAGFLPPNQIAPEGEGSVSYRVKAKTGLLNNTIIRNQAKIVFDINDPIFTNTWINTIDNESPQGQVVEINSKNDSTFIVSWNATDGGSKVRYYNLYIAIEDEEFISLGRYNKNQAQFEGNIGKTYHFSAVPVDSVGNVQDKPIVAEKSITLTESDPATRIDKDRYNMGISILPNPAETHFILQLHLGETDTPYQLELIAVDGRRFSLGEYNSDALQAGIRISADKYPRGLYLLKLESDERQFTQKIVFK